jgi:hypothetical protein
MLTLGVAVGLAVGASAWAISTARTTSTTNDAAAFGAVHEKIEAHQAAVAAGADRANDQIETHRTAAANAAAGAQANSGFDQIEAHRTMVANQAAGVFDHRLDNVVTHYALPAVTAPFSPRGIVPDVAKTAPAWHAASIVGTVTTPVGRAYSQGIVLGPTPRVFDPGGETPDTRGGVPAGIAPDYYRPYIDKMSGTTTLPLVRLPDSAVDAASPGDTPWGPRSVPLSAVKSVQDLSIRRGYDPVLLPATKLVGRAYTQGIVIGTVSIGTANGADAIGGYPWQQPLR